MKRRHVLFVMPAVFSFVCPCAALAGNTVGETGAMACVVDKWSEKEPEKGHKIADSVLRCVAVPDDPTVEKYAQDCSGTYEYMPDGSWKGAGTCARTFKDGGKSFEKWEEGSHMKEYTYEKTGGTGKYEGLRGGGTYMYEALTDTLFGGRYSGKLESR